MWMLLVSGLVATVEPDRFPPWPNPSEAGTRYMLHTIHTDIDVATDQRIRPLDVRLPGPLDDARLRLGLLRVRLKVPI